jgi:DNA-binding transcriptional regulator YiaG
MAMNYCRDPDCNKSFQTVRGRNNHESKMHPETDFRVVRIIDGHTKTEDGCWMWEGATNPQDYGVIEVKNESYRAHRLSYEVFCGELKEGKQINHKCHKRTCVNPAHLYQGTHQDNMDDAVEEGSYKETTLKGEEMHNAKLTGEDVKELRQRYKNEDISQRDLADEYGVCQRTVSQVVNHEKWTHV